ncbi:hypothetical protein [Edaphobacter modestus]|uniref:hypothetical protein n=1 Tax=Edaphobacter modestus TaxID=388466 RepID=UPI00102C293C|nr:hypothetical protein [Edaphobacter modestus]
MIKTPVTPHLAFNPVSKVEVRDVHLRPLFTTAIHVPQHVSSLAVGAPTLFEVEHKDSEPDLVFVKPSTHQAAESNLLIALVGGETISLRLISSGDGGSPDPVDFVVDYRRPKSLFESAGIADVGAPTEASTQHLTVKNAMGARPAIQPMDADTAVGMQGAVGAPHWMTAPELAKLIKANALAPNNIAIAVGDVRQEGETMTVSFSVLNISDHWITVMPPQIELTNPLISKKEAKKKGNFAQPIVSSDYRLDNPKLSPGARSDGSITFPKPDSKLTKESLLLHIATSASIDTPVYYPLPFVAPSSAELIEQKDNDNARN